jgi:hypothetical protein
LAPSIPASAIDGELGGDKQPASPMDPLVRQVADAIAREDWEELKPLLHPYLHWTGADGGTVRGRTKVLERLKEHPVSSSPESFEVRDGQVYRWAEPSGGR